MSQPVTKNSVENNAAQQAQRIAIVGGGMVGVSLAIMLSQKLPDSTITLIEKFPFKASATATQETTFQPTSQPSFDARSTALSAGSVQLLEQMQCWQTLAPFAAPIDHIHISDRGHYGSTQLHANDYAVDALGYVIENRILGEVLLQRLQKTPVNCLTPAVVERCQFTQNSAQLHIQQKESSQIIDTDVVLIADGSDSPLSRSLGIDYTKKPYGQSAIIANVALSQPHNNIAYERFTEQGPLAVLPLPDFDGLPRASVVWTRNSDGVNELLSLDDAAFTEQLQACFGFRAGYIQQVGQRQEYPLELVQSVEQVRSRMVVLGNAAHFLHPVAGQGFNLSLRDCDSLVSVLHSAAADAQPLGHYSILKKYIQQRERDQQLTIGLTDTMVKLFSSENLSRSVMRQCGLLSLHALPAAKKLLARQMMGMSL